ncbi:MAG: NYN domain-containing protein [Halobacteriota archaeon]
MQLLLELFENQGFIDKLQSLPRFEVKKGKLQIIGGEFKQKMVDVLMSLGIVDRCLANQIQHAILIAGDSDFVPAIKKAKDYGAIIHLYYHHPLSKQNELLKEIDEPHTFTQEFIDKILR